MQILNNIFVFFEIIYMKYSVDVLMLVYNHEKFIVQAIESVLNQKTNFKYRLIIAEDCSIDKSREIIKGYVEKYPDIIYPLYNEVNLGISRNVTKLLSAITAPYAAFCDGDDYWIDENKLQIQFDFLENNSDFTMCFTSSKVQNESNTKLDYPYATIDKDVFNIEDFIYSTKVYAPTSATFFRCFFPQPIPTFIQNAVSYDIAIYIFLVDKGLAKYLPYTMAVYRQHQGGVTKTKEHIEKGDDKQFQLYEEANAYYEYKYDRFFRKKLLEMSKIKLIYGSRDLTGTSKLKHVFKNRHNYFKYSDRINIKEIIYYTLVLFFPKVLKMATIFKKK